MLSAVAVMEMSCCCVEYVRTEGTCSVDELVKVVLLTAVLSEGRMWLCFQGSGSMAVDEVLEF